MEENGGLFRLNDLILKKEGWLWAGLAMLFILPFLVLSAFNHPVNDDFCYAFSLKEKGLFEMFRYGYMTWSGRLGGYLTLFFNPLLTKSFIVFKFFVFGYIILFLFSVYLFIHKFLDKTNYLQSLVYALFIGALYFSMMPSVQQGLFWYNGAAAYLFPVIYACLAYYLFDSHRAGSGAAIKNSFAIFLVFWATTSNEIYCVIMLFFVLLALYISFIGDKKLNKWLIIMVLAILAGTAIMKLSPGNRLRQTSMSSKHVGEIAYALKAGSKLLVKFLYKWISGNILLWALTVLAIPFAYQHVKRSNSMAFEVPLITPIAFLGLIWFIFVLFHFLSGDAVMPARLINIGFLIFIASWFYGLFLILKLTYRTSNPDQLTVPFFVRVVLFLLIAFCLKDNNVRIAYMDLASGRAQRYNQELNQRYLQMAGPDQQIVVPALKDQPQSICGADIHATPEHWENTCYADYFLKKSIVTDQETNH